MKRLLVTLALAFVAVPSFAAIQYEFMQKNITGDIVTPTTDLTARAIVDGPRSRVEFLSGNLYPPGTYVISTDGSRRLFFIDPEKRWYTEVNTSGIATALASSNIKIENFKQDVQKFPASEKIAGIDTEHRRVTMSYDVTLPIKDMPLRQHVQTEIETWATNKFGAVHQGFFSGGLRTGNPDIDRVLEAELSSANGFPLRQIVTIRTSYDLQHRSNLQTPTTRTITRETWVTSIGEIKAQPAQFVVPASFRRADQPELPKPGPQVLTFEDSGTK
jgi:hypothetical protein